MSLQVGSTVKTTTGITGVLRYVGPINAAPGVWCGLELSDASGKNDGSIKGQVYFQCPAKHGIFVKKEAVKPVAPVSAPSPTKPAAPSTKRQSIVELNPTPRRPPPASESAQIEDLKGKIRVLEKKRLEDRENSKKVVELQRKIEELQQGTSQRSSFVDGYRQELLAVKKERDELKHEVEDLNLRLQEEHERPAQIESQLELATLDREMAEEKAEGLQLELDMLRAKHEELSLEIEIIREENSELSQNMTEEEKANAGWLHLERERDRLREALLLLRDHKQEVETELRHEIGYLQENLNETEEAASKYLETAEMLHRMEETNIHLKEQLEAAESQEEIVANMMQERDRHISQIEGLRTYLSELEELVQTNEDIEKFYADNERGLLSRLDEQEAMLHEKDRKTTEQERTIENLEYTLTKFRSVVQGLQSDIDEARRTREISELQAHEMNAKSRAMMELNHQLQNNAAKSQTKTIEIEMVKAQAILSARHVEILTSFVPESFDSERTPVMAFLAFSRLRTKAELVSQMLVERLPNRAHLDADDQILACYEIVMHIRWMQLTAEDFVAFMSTCSPTEFHAFSNAAQELEPVERAVTNWLEALKSDELSADGPDDIRRMRNILHDMKEKLLPPPMASPEVKSSQLVSQMKIIQMHMGLAGRLLTWLSKTVQARLGAPTDDDVEAISFDKKVDQLATLARTNQYVCTRVVRELELARAKNKCLTETAWSTFDDVEQRAESLRANIHHFCRSALRCLDEAESTEISYPDFLEDLSAVPKLPSFSEFLERLTAIQGAIEQVSSLANSAASTTLYTPNPPPWIVRAKEVRAQRLISADVQEDLANLNRRNAELASRIADKERAIEEVTIRAELAEKRAKDTKARDAAEKAHREELDKLKSEKDAIEQELQSMKYEILNMREQSARDRDEITTLTELSKADSKGTPALDAVVGGSHMDMLDGHVKSLLAEIESLEATTRFLSWENAQLTTPISEVRFKAAEAWLSPLKSRKRLPQGRFQNGREEVMAMKRLLEISKNVKPMRLKK
ncbi:hypothetical protein H2198_001044 [Neophaeococcomyces mojaviensis]|uniref:Uncharacterized protein n=1 Tax=Neophaeococcomyces mojaviensis TaxID=3383035 RepID=A0ACC3AIP1_9EURO|nr:hypothetical protein H2198_001044 [Knufia sp. JES_112]